MGIAEKAYVGQEGLRGQRSSITCILALLNKGNLEVFQSQSFLF